MSRATLDTAGVFVISDTRLSLPLAGLPRPFSYILDSLLQSVTPVCTHTGLGSYDFARRYFRNRFYFLFLRLLRCFSSAGSLRMIMDSSYGTWSLSMWVPPFGYQRIAGYLLLPVAFRSLSRPSSAPSARASALCSFCLTASADI